MEYLLVRNVLVYQICNSRGFNKRRDHTSPELLAGFLVPVTILLMLNKYPVSYTVAGYH